LVSSEFLLMCSLVAIENDGFANQRCSWCSNYFGWREIPIRADVLGSSDDYRSGVPAGGKSIENGMEVGCQGVNIRVCIEKNNVIVDTLLPRND